MSDPLGEGLGVSGLPGLGPKPEQESRTFLFNDSHVEVESVRIDKDTDDDANTGKVHKLRAGMAVVRVEAGGNKGKYVDVAHADAPAAGSIVHAGILRDFVDMRDKDGNREDKQAVVVIHGFVNEADVIYNTADGPTIQAIKDALPLVHFRVAVV